MLSPQLRRKVHDLWSLFWSSGLSNPLVAIEQITYLLFLRQLEALDRDHMRRGKPSIYDLSVEEARERKKQIKAKVFRNQTSLPENYEKCRWSHLRQKVSFALLNNIFDANPLGLSREPYEAEGNLRPDYSASGA